MDERDLPGLHHATGDYWDVYAEALDLTLEGHRLIAQEIGYETKLLWRGALSWLRRIGSASRRRAFPPV